MNPNAAQPHNTEHDMGMKVRRENRRGHAQRRIANAEMDVRELIESGKLSPAEVAQLEEMLASAEAYAAQTIASGTRSDAVRSNSAIALVSDLVERLEDKYDLAVGSSGGSDGACGSELVELMDDPAALVDHFERDPSEFMRSYQDLSAEERSVVMQRLQMQMQMDNQITQMITNLMKALHDTSMAVARNLKV